MYHWCGMTVVHSQVGRDLLGSVAVRLRRVDLAPIRRHQPAVAVGGVWAAHLPSIMAQVGGCKYERVRIRVLTHRLAR